MSLRYRLLTVLTLMQWKQGGKVVLLRDRLKSYLDKSHDEGAIRVEYRRTGKASCGRQFAVGGLSLQSLVKEVRCTIAHDHYNDIDIVNAHPVILDQYCDKYGIQAPYLKQYVSDRDSMIAEIMRLNGLERGDVKQSILSILYGGKRGYNSIAVKPEWLKKLKGDVFRIHEAIMSAGRHEEMVHSLRNRRMSTGDTYNLAGSVTSHVICEIEDKLLMSFIDALRARDIDVGNIVLVFDGFMLPKSTVVDDDLLAYLSEYACEQVDYDVKLVLKSMEEGVIDLSYFPGMSENLKWLKSYVEVPTLASDSVVVSRLSFNPLWSNERSYCVFSSKEDLAKYVSENPYQCEFREVLPTSTNFSPRVFFRLHDPSNNYPSSTIIHEFGLILNALCSRWYTPYTPYVLGETMHVSSSSTTGISSTVRVVLDSRLSTTPLLHAMAVQLRDFTLSLRKLYPSLCYTALDGSWASVVDLSTYSDLHGVCVPLMFEALLREPFMMHPSSCRGLDGHLEEDIVRQLVSGRTDCFARIRFEEPIHIQHRTISQGMMRPLTVVENQEFAGYLNTWPAMAHLFGGGVCVASVTSRDGNAWVELMQGTPCPYIGRCHSDGEGGLYLSVDDLHHSAKVVCEHAECVNRGRANSSWRELPIVLTGSTLSITDSLDGVRTSTQHNQSTIIDWYEDYCEPVMRPLPGDVSFMCVVAQMGLGKTKAVVEFVRNNYTSGSRILAISFSIELSRKTNAHLRTTGLDFVLYQDVKGGISAPCVTVCLDSLKRVVGGDFDLVIIDEIQSVLGHFNSPLMEDTGGISYKLERLLTNAEKVILVDACADSTSVNLVIDHLQRLRSIEARVSVRSAVVLSAGGSNDEQCQCCWIRNRFIMPTNRTMQVVVGDKNTNKAITEASLKYAAIDQLVSLLNDGKNVVCISNIKTFAVACEKIAKERQIACPQFKHAAYYGNGPTRLEDPLIEWIDLNLLIYSPTITAGISFELKHFHSLVAYIDNSDYAPNIDMVIQMLYRVRVLIDGRMYVYFKPSRKVFDGTCTAAGVSATLTRDRFSANQYLRDRMISYHPITKCASRDGDPMYDIERLSWSILLGYVVSRNKGLANGLNILVTTLKDDYGVDVKFSTLDVETGHDLDVAEAMEAVKAPNDVPFDQLDLGITQETMNLYMNTAQSSVELASVRLFQVRTRCDVLVENVDEEFYLSYVTDPKGEGELFKIRRFLERMVFKSCELKEKMDKYMSWTVSKSDPNLDIYKKTMEYRTVLIVGQEVLERVLQDKEIEKLERFEEVYIKEDRMSFVEVYMSSLSGHSRIELGKLFKTTSISKNSPLQFFKSVVNRAFGVKVERSVADKKLLKIDSLDVQMVLMRYLPYGWKM